MLLKTNLFLFLLLTSSQFVFSQNNYLAVQGGVEFFPTNSYIPYRIAVLSLGESFNVQYIRVTSKNIFISAGLLGTRFSYHKDFTIDTSTYGFHNDLTGHVCSYCRLYDEQYRNLQMGLSFSIGYQFKVSRKVDLQVGTGCTGLFVLQSLLKDHYYTIDSTGAMLDPGPFEEVYINQDIQHYNKLLPDYFSIPILFTGLYRIGRNKISLQTGIETLCHYDDNARFIFPFKIGVLHLLK